MNAQNEKKTIWEDPNSNLEVENFVIGIFLNLIFA